MFCGYSIRSWLSAAIRNERIDDEGCFLLQISISRRDLKQFESRELIPLESMLS